MTNWRVNMHFLANFRLALSCLALVLLGACNDNSRENTSSLLVEPPASEVTVLSGVAATGAALDGASVEIIDASGNLVDVGDVLTGSDGSYQIALPSNIALPVIVRVTPPNGTPLLNIVAPPADGSTTITANVNPVTDLVSSSALGDVDSSDPSALAGALTGVDTSTLEATGDAVLARILGSSVKYSSFTNDPNFVAKTVDTSTTPSATDAILDTLAKQAQSAGTNIKAQLKSLEQQATPSRLLEEPAFQVGLIGEMIKGGAVATDLEAQLQSIGAINEPVAGESDVFRAVIATVPSLIETVRNDSTSLAGDTALLDLATDAAVDMLANTMSEKKNRFATDPAGLVSALNSPSLQQAVTKVVQSSVVPTLAQFIGSGGDAATQNSLATITRRVTTGAATVASTFTFTETSTDVSSLVSQFVATNVAPTSIVTAQDLTDSAVDGGASLVRDIGDVNNVKSSITGFATENSSLIEGTVDSLTETIPAGIWDQAVWSNFNWG
ncbi:MAG: hypothetical protein ACI96P_001460 [Candidatus Azotimanducaceae bacterium]|jgi:hypothetical protein